MQLFWGCLLCATKWRQQDGSSHELAVSRTANRHICNARLAVTSVEMEPRMSWLNKQSHTTLHPGIHQLHCMTLHGRAYFIYNTEEPKGRTMLPCTTIGWLKGISFPSLPSTHSCAHMPDPFWIAGSYVNWEHLCFLLSGLQGGKGIYLFLVKIGWTLHLQIQVV